MINIGSRREVLWDDFLIDTDNTTAELRMNPPQKRELAMKFDKPWEGPSCDYMSVWQDGDIYRMYYNACGYPIKRPEGAPADIKVCYMESKDGIHWERPNLGIVEFDGSKENNIILWYETDYFDNFFAFKDENPECKPEERYKAVAECGYVGSLWGYTSSDAIHWNRRQLISTKGKFDTLNTAHWDSETGLYYCYIRDFHDSEVAYAIRDVRCMTSKDFWNWSDPIQLNYGDDTDDYPLYTNNVGIYLRAPHMKTGFPTRYIDHDLLWTKNLERLTNREKRLNWYNAEKRGGTTITDCVFMSSRDGVNFRRFDEAWLTPGPEAPTNWVYGDCYPMWGMIEVDDDFPSGDKVFSMYCSEGKGGADASYLYRYNIRLDGFASYHSTYKKKKVTTKPFIFEGEQLKLNFKTSAIGSVVVKVLDENYNELDGFFTCELLGDKVDRPVDFENGDISTLQGKPIRLEFEMCDSDIFSFIFGKAE